MRHLNSYFILEQFNQGHANGRLPAIGMFVDISGFTTVTDTLMTHGQHGAEVLASVMVDLFSPLVELVYVYGGDICNFAGDAFTAFFPILNDHTKEAAERTLAVAWHIQRKMLAKPNYETTYGTFAFSAKVGVAYGLLEWGILRGADPEQNTYYFKGTAIDGCAIAEHYASGGDVVLDCTVYETLSDLVTVTAANGSSNHVKVTQLMGALPLSKPVQLPEITLAQATAFHTPSLLTQHVNGEFRYALNVFINLRGVDTHQEVGEFMQTIFALQKQYGGFLNRIDFGDKGCHLLMFWGAPTTYENDVERAINFILDLKDSTDVPIRVGITYRISHAGFIGSPLRAEYTCYGRGVNLASRYMMHAPWGDVWLDEEINQRAQDKFVTEFIDRLLFKGLSEKQAVYLLKQRRRTAVSPTYSSQMIGRQQELDRLLKAIGPIFEGRFAGITTIYGEAGIGKSRLLFELRQCLTNSDQHTAVHWLHCPADEILRQSLNPFRYWLRNYFQQSVNHTEAENKQQFQRKLDMVMGHLTNDTIKHELERTASMLGALVDLHWPHSLYQKLDPKLRFENTLAALKNLIKAESLYQPVVLELEDGHWLDEDSRKLISVLTRNIDDFPIAIVCGYRYQDDGSKLTLPVSTTIPQDEINLMYLVESDIKNLACHILQGDVSLEVVRFLAEKTNGNPFFVEQLILDLKERNLFLRQENQEKFYYTLQPFRAEDVPATINAVLVSRLDRLLPEVKEIVQTASVLGPEFNARVLEQMLSPANHLAQLINHAEAEQIWFSSNQMLYTFRHALMRDAAYDMQLRTRLRDLHQHAAKSYESLYKGNLPEYYANLAYHYEKAEIVPKATLYLEKAGDEAKGNYQNDAAISFYNRLLKYSLTDATKLSLYVRQSDILNLTGQWETAVDILEEGLHNSWSDDRSPEKANLHVILGDVLRRTGRYDQALIHLEEAKKIAEALEDQKLLGRTLSIMAGSYLYKGDFDKALEINQAALKLYAKENDQHGIAVSLSGVGASLAAKGSYHEALNYLLKAIPIFESLGDKGGLIYPLVNAGIVFYDLGEYQSGLDYCQKTVQECLEIGDREGVWVGLHALGRIHIAMNDFKQAVIYFQESQQLRLEMGETGLPFEATPYLAYSHFQQGERVKALEALLFNFQRIEEIGRDVEHGHGHLVMGLILAVRQEDKYSWRTQPEMALFAQITTLTRFPLEATAYFTFALETAVESNYPETFIPTMYHYGEYLYAQVKDLASGLAHLSAAKEQALIYQRLGEITQIKRICERLHVDFDAL